MNAGVFITRSTTGASRSIVAPAPRADIDARIDAFAARFIEVLTTSGVDEVVVLGHSLGASFAIEMLSRALQRAPDAFRSGPKVALLTVGATVPKFSLHPQATWLRAAIARIVNEPAIFWGEYQARDDAISFYLFDPARLERVYRDGHKRKPYIRIVQIYDMVTPAMFARIGVNRMRLHYQFVMANDMRCPYDYFLFAAGPLPVQDVVRAPDGYQHRFKIDGEDVGALLPPEAA